jgi:hypothetical protein
MADRDLVVIDRMCAVTLALPFGIGFLLYGSLAGALSAVQLATRRVGLAPTR